MNEFELIDRITAGFPKDPSVTVGIGDDCAVMDMGLGDRELVLKTDSVVQGVHFDDQVPFEGVGRKALARCLSDFAAMAAIPRYAMITLGLPKNFCPNAVQEIYGGFQRLAEEFQVTLVGGETTSQPQGISLGVTVMGWAPKGKAIQRVGSRIGDAIFVSGELGGSRAFHHYLFQPRLREAEWLRDNFKVKAMIDLSDGLAGDLAHLLGPDAPGAELLSTAIPVRRRPNPLENQPEEGVQKTPVLAALTDGEDYELLFTVARGDAVRLRDEWVAQFPEVRISCIGKFVATPGVHLREKNEVRSITPHGYLHFT